MAAIEAVLTYTAGGLGQEVATLTLGCTRATSAILAVRNQLIVDAWGEAALWRGVDPGLAAMKSAEAERLARVLEFLMPGGIGDMRAEQATTEPECPAEEATDRG